MEKQLRGKVAIVTGASKGIGAAIAEHMGLAGAAVAVNYNTSREGAERVVKKIEDSGGRAIAVHADLAKEHDIVRLFEETKRAFSAVDILVNNAGLYEFVSIEEVTADHFHRMFNVNVLGLLFACREAVKHFGPGGGSIVNISSVAATNGPPNASVYSATKGAVDTITRSLSKELGLRKIRINSINPGLVETEGVQAGGFNDPSFSDRLLTATPLGRIGQPDDIAPAAVFLASDAASWLTGETLYISGGYR